MLQLARLPFKQNFPREFKMAENAGLGLSRCAEIIVQVGSEVSLEA